VVISPLQWADSTAKHIAEKVERGMVEGAEDAQGTNYPDLEAARRREETYDFWTEMINKGFNKCRWGGRNREDASSAPPQNRNCCLAPGMIISIKDYVVEKLRKFKKSRDDTK
jgi:hypothetical protein